jgi:HIRAN domain
MSWRFFYTKVRGVSYCNHDGSNRQQLIARCRIGEELQLVREPGNPVSSDAVKTVRRTGEQIGYLSAYVVGRGLAKDLDKGVIIRCRISALTGGGELTRGVNLELWIWEGADIPDCPPWPIHTDGRSPAGSEMSAVYVALLLTVAVVIVAVIFFLSR